MTSLLRLPGACCVRALLALLTLGGCAATSTMAPNAVIAAARDTPDRFLVATADGLVVPDGSGDACRSPMADPRDDTRIHMVRAGDGRGDYDVPDGRYGVGPRQLLRLDCRTGTVLGIVRR